jgi:hypothetical protein
MSADFGLETMATSPKPFCRPLPVPGQLARVNECSRDFSAIIFNNHRFTARSQDCRWLPSVAIFVFVNWQSLCTSVGEKHPATRVWAEASTAMLCSAEEVPIFDN